MKYTVGHEALDDPYHIDIIKEKLTRMLPTVLPDLTEELAVSVQDYIPTKCYGELCRYNCPCVRPFMRFRVRIDRMDRRERDDDDAEDRRPSQQPCLCRAAAMCVAS